MNVIAVDLDGTIQHNGQPIERTVQWLAERFEDYDNFIVIYTARSYSLFHPTRKWLVDHDVKHHALVMEKMRATFYMDDRGIHLP